MIDLFTVFLTYEVEKTKRDEFGWIEGHEPGHGRYESGAAEYRVVAPDEEMARFMALKWVSGSGFRNVEVASVERTHIHAIVSVKHG